MNKEREKERERVHYTHTHVSVYSVLFIRYKIMNEIKRRFSDDGSINKGMKIFRNVQK
jgi:hypothetical protein